MVFIIFFKYLCNINVISLDYSLNVFNNNPCSIIEIREIKFCE